MDGEISYYSLDQLSPEQRARLMIRTEADLSDFIKKVKPIIENVRKKGDAALAFYARKFDQAPVRADQIKCRPREFAAAEKGFDPILLAAIGFAAESVSRFHEDQKPGGLRMSEIRPGVFTGEKVTPIESVACYVPRGKGAFPSCVLMSVIPAKVAGVPNISIITPPGPDGRVDAATLVAARLSGVEDVYKCGGAQGIAAVAYGTKTVPKAHKVVGPGSPWVVAAKRVLAEVIDPGLAAGPSEALVLADDTANSRVATLDLINESEHGPDSSAYLVTSSRRIAEEVRELLPEYWAQLAPLRASFSREVLCGNKGGIILAPDMDAAIAFANDYAPEHLMVLSAEPFQYLGRLTNAGEILLGEHTPLAIGNYVLGPSHVLPTSGAARTWSPLSVYDFLKRTSVGYVTAPAYGQLAGHAHTLATYEGFDGHALAVSRERKQAMNT